MFTKLFSGITRLSNAVHEMADIFEKGCENLRQNNQSTERPFVLDHEDESVPRISKERNGKQTSKAR